MKNFSLSKLLMFCLSLVAVVLYVKGFHAHAGMIMAAGPMYIPNNSGGSGGKVKMPQVLPMTAGRSVLDYLKKQYPSSTVISESYLRMENVLANSTTSYQFNIQQNPGVDAPTEYKLSNQDLFAVTHIGMFLGQRDNVNSKSSAIQLETFPCNALLDAATANVVINDLYSLYNGYLNIKIATTTFFDAIPGLDFLFIPVTQQDTVSAAVEPAAGPPSTTFTPFNNQRNKDSAYVQLSSVLVFSGQAQNYITYNVPQMTSKIQCTSTANRNIFALIFRGFIIKNAALITQLSWNN